MRCALLMGILGLFTLLGQPAQADNSKGFQLTVDGKQVGIDIGETLTVTTGEGKEIKVTLDRSKFVTSSGAFFSFDHAGNLGVVESDIGGGIKQYLLNTALGTMVIVQEYEGVDPSSLTQLMVQQLTAKSKQAGAKIVELPKERKLDSGKVLKGLNATVRGKFSSVDIEVVAYGNPDQGIIIVTQIDRDYEQKEGAMIDMFWKSLKIKF